MQINIKYFAALREQAGVSTEVLETNANTGRELFEEIKNKYGLSFESKHIRLAVNEEYADFDQILKADDTVVFIPPVAGG